MILSLIISLCLTIIIELAVSLVIGIRNKNDIKIIICVNVLTNPVVVYTTNCVKLLNNNLVYNIIVIIMEILAVIVEGKIFKRYLEYKEKNPFFISTLNNCISFSLGIIISNIILK